MKDFIRPVRWIVLESKMKDLFRFVRRVVLGVILIIVAGFAIIWLFVSDIKKRKPSDIKRKPKQAV